MLAGIRRVGFDWLIVGNYWIFNVIVYTLGYIRDRRRFSSSHGQNSVQSARQNDLVFESVWPLSCNRSIPLLVDLIANDSFPRFPQCSALYAVWSLLKDAIVWCLEAGFHRVTVRLSWKLEIFLLWRRKNVPRVNERLREVPFVDAVTSKLFEFLSLQTHLSHW